MKTGEIKRAINLVLQDAAGSDFAGYDPYDALNTSWSFLRKGKWPPVLLIQALKRIPVNLRPLLGIKKGHNPKGIGLLLETCALMERQHLGEYTNHINRLLSLLEELQTKGYTGACWGYNFEWASPVKVLPPYSPTIVVTGFISKALFEVLELGQNDRAESLFRDIEHFIAEDLPQFSDATGICISYSTVKKDCCFNASLLAAGYYARLYTLTHDEIHARRAKEIVNFVVHRQKPDGSWAYSIDLETGKERIQTDFHQGFVLDSILETMKYLDERPEDWVRAIEKGAAFYFKHQFSEDGRSFFRLPRRFPTDIHHQAQGIVTAMKCSESGFEYRTEADRILKWGMKHLYNGKGKFYYRVFPVFTDRTNYLRWGQSWMALAMAKWYTSKVQNAE